MSDPSRLARRVALASLAISAVLAALKISVGLAARSVAAVSDGLESGTDFLTSGLVLLGLWIAAKPADRDHPYGHGRFETLTALAIGVLLAAIGTAISIGSLAGRYEAHAPAIFAIWPLLLSIVVKAALAGMKFRAGKRTGSSGLAADAGHDLVDMFSGVVALLGLSLAVVFPGSMTAADHDAGFAVGLVVIFLGLRVVKNTALQLMDTMPDSAQMAEIRAAAIRVKGVMGIEKCYARKTGLRYHVDLHLEVDPDLSVRTSHEIATAVKHAVKSEVAWVQDVLVHVEPYGMLQDEVTIRP